MNTTFFSSAAWALLASTAAFAGGYVQPSAPLPPVVVAPAPVVADWTGFYGGIQVDYASVELPFDNSVVFEGSGGLTGFFGGYRYDFGNFTLGAELDLSFGDFELSDVGGNTLQGEFESLHRLGAEVGFDAGRALFYGTAGAAQMRADLDLGSEVEGNGYFYGIGVDYLVTDRIVLGAELLQHEFTDLDHNFLNIGLDGSIATFGISAALRF